MGNFKLRFNPNFSSIFDGAFFRNVDVARFVIFISPKVDNVAVNLSEFRQS